MSFMFNPLPYDDMSYINQLCLPEGVSEAVVSGSAATAGYLSTAAKNKLSNGSDFCIIAMEGYISAQWEQVIDLMARNISESGIEFVTYDISEYYKPAEELNKMFDHLLPQDRVKDPVLLFGRLTDGSYEDIKLKGNTTKAAIKSILKDKNDDWFNSVAKEGKDNHNKKILDSIQISIID